MCKRISSNYQILPPELSEDRKPGSLIARYDCSQYEQDIDFAKALLGCSFRYARIEGSRAEASSKGIFNRLKNPQLSPSPGRPSMYPRLPGGE